MDFIIDFLTKAVAALLKILGYEVDEELLDNIENAIEDVVDFGNEAAK